MKQKEAFIAGNRVKGNPVPIPGSTIHTCRDCNNDMYVSPATLETAKKMTDRKIIFLCIPCFKIVMEKEKGVAIMPPTKDQFAEIKKRLKETNEN